MRRTSLLAVLGMFVIAGSAFAAQTPTAAKSTAPKPTVAKPAAPKPAPSAWAAGKIQSFDASAKTLVVKQGSHDMTFVLAPTAQLLQGKKAIQASDLTSDVGRNVKIRYAMSAGARSADRVEVSEPPAPPAKKGK